MVYILKRVLTQGLAIYAVLVALLLAFFCMDSAIAVEIDRANRTVPLNQAGQQATLTVEQFSKGQHEFNNSCAQCHVDGGTKTNPDVDLSPETLANATPARSNIVSIVDYLIEPTTYDGLKSLAEFHPSKPRADIFPTMRDLSEEDLAAIAGYILAEPKIIGDQWGGGKPKR